MRVARQVLAILVELTEPLEVGLSTDAPTTITWVGLLKSLLCVASLEAGRATVWALFSEERGFLTTVTTELRLNVRAILRLTIITLVPATTTSTTTHGVVDSSRDHLTEGVVNDLDGLVELGVELDLGRETSSAAFDDLLDECLGGHQLCCVDTNSITPTGVSLQGSVDSSVSGFGCLPELGLNITTSYADVKHLATHLLETSIVAVKDVNTLVGTYSIILDLTF